MRKIYSHFQQFGDRTLVCSKCGKEVFIPFNQVGGFWHLAGFETQDGEKHFGGHCPECFDKIYENRKKINE
jgi:DNA-directed RNA polymerase subunit RPC12/RpoP